MARDSHPPAGSTGPPSDRDLERIRALFRSQPHAAVQVLAAWAPLPLAVLRRGAWNAAQLSANPHLPWRRLLKEQSLPFPVRWPILSRNRGDWWDADLIHRHRSSWDWSVLSRNPALPWSPAFVARFSDRWKLRSFERHLAAWRAVEPAVDVALIEELGS